MRRTSSASMFMTDGEPNGGTRLGDGTGRAKESKRKKRVQEWFRHIGLSALLAIHCKLFSI